MKLRKWKKCKFIRSPTCLNFSFSFLTFNGLLDKIFSGTMQNVLFESELFLIFTLPLILHSSFAVKLSQI